MKNTFIIYLIVCLLTSCNKEKDDNMPMNYYTMWGLGNTLQYEFSNNRNYDWYIDQMTTGHFANINCGPTSVTMAIKWANEDFNRTPEEARNTYRINGGGWSTYDIINYLNLYHINNKVIRIDSVELLKNEINDSNIVIALLDMNYIRYSSTNENRVDKYYKTTKGFSHYIVLKGYKIVDDSTFYEVYDPNSYGMKYQDMTLKGKDRYYRSSDINKASNNYWDYAIIISKDATKKMLGIDFNIIKHMNGK